MEVKPLAAESLGVRSAAFRVALDDTELLIDPGTGVNDTPSYRPHVWEFEALQRAASRIDEAAKTADAVVVTHYHFDHFVPLEPERYRWSTAERSRKVFDGTHVFVKDRSNSINQHQQKRARELSPVFSGVAAKLTEADGKTRIVEPFTLRFSPAVPHGGGAKKFGYVIMVAIEGPEVTVVYTSDVGGPIEADSVTWIEDQAPDLILADGPTMNLPGGPNEDVAKAQSNLCRLAGTADLVVDHHVLRERYREEFLEPIEAAAADAGHTVDTATGYLGEPRRPLEAWRSVFHANYPVPDSFYEQLETNYHEDIDLGSMTDIPSLWKWDNR